MKKLLSVLLSLAMVLTLVPAAFAADLSDVKETDWFYDAANYVSENGLMVGTDKGFEPDRETSRAMIWTILARLDGVDTSVNDGAWYATAQKWSMEEGVSDGSDPDGFITREQFAAMLYRFAGMKGLVKAEDVAALTGFTDAASVTAYAVEPLSWAVACGIVGGMGDGTICPQGLATRAQVAAMLMRFCQRFDLIKEEYTVTFELNYGSEGVYKTVDVEDGGTVSQPKNPSRSGYSFLGWYTRAENGTKFDFSTKITADLTLFAHWSRNSYSGGGYSHSHYYTLKSNTATCTADGVKTWGCSCGETKTESSPALGHDFKLVEDTTGQYKCSRCDSSYTVSGGTTPEEVVVTVTVGSTTTGYSDFAAALTAALPGQSNTSATITLVKDLDLSNWTKSFEGNYKNFTLDGANFTISGLTKPLFASLGQGTQTIKDLNFKAANINVTGTGNGAGVLVGNINAEGTNSLTIENCTVSDSKVNAYQYAGAFVGHAAGYNGTINFNNCTVTNTTVSTDDSSAGALIGHTYNNCNINSCTVQGGSVGCAEAEAGDAKAGYFVGTVNAGTTTISGSAVNGTSLNNDTLKNEPVANGLVGRCYGTVIVEGTAYVAAAQLKAVLTASNSVTLDRDYKVTDEWTSLTKSGDWTINGNGHSISGLTKPLLAGNAADKLTIKKLTIKDSAIGQAADENGLGTGAFACYMDATSSANFEDCHLVNSTVTGSERAAGLIAYSSTAALTIKNCSVENCTIEAVGGAGGLVAYTMKATTVENSSVTKSTIRSTEDRSNGGNPKSALAGSVVGTVNGGISVTFRNVTSTGNTVVNTSSQPAYSEMIGRVLGGSTLTMLDSDGNRLVSTQAELKAALTGKAQDADYGTILLLNDIDMTGWTAIEGTYRSFVLDGQGHALKKQTEALFIHLGVGTYTIKNLNFDEAEINRTGTTAEAAVIVYEMQNNGGVNLTIENCHVKDSTVHGYKYAAGFIGFTNESNTEGKPAIVNITNCTVTNTKITTDDSSAGGLVGHGNPQQLNITNCKILGTTSIKCAENRANGAAKAGYLVGTVNGGATTITNCEVASTVTLTNVNASSTVENGLVGRNVDGTVVKN